MPILTAINNWFNLKRIRQLDRMRKFPVEVQQETFGMLVKRAEDTVWGRQYDYRSIDSFLKFQERVPVTNYEDFKPYIDRTRQGEADLIWPGEIKWFAKSSGTTSDKSKFIPVSRESLDQCHFRGGRDVLAIYCNHYPESRIFSGKSLTLGGSHKIDNLNNQSYHGDLSAILIENLPFWTEFIRTPSHDTALIDKFEEKLEKIAGETIKLNVTSLVGVPSWNLVMIKYLLNYTGKRVLTEIWPNIELFIHGGVSFTPYREEFAKIIPSANMHYLEAYNASEGFFSIQDDPDDTGMLLMLDYGIFYEFIPADDVYKSNPKAYTIGEVKEGINYAIVITTNSGLWRYLIGDTVKFTSLYPHKLVVTGRTKHFINAFGEELIVDNADKALKTACEKTSAIIAEYSAAPVFMSKDKQGSHEWIIEFSEPPDNLEKFTNSLDEALMSVNSDYEAKRYKNLTLVRPLVRQAEPGTFYRWFEIKGKLGGQNKVPRLSNDRKYVEELNEINEMIKSHKN